MKQYKTGLVIGRFQPIHIGHEKIINKALELCDKVIVFVGSSDKSGTKDNPLSYDFRKGLLELIYGNNIEIYPLKDLGVGNVFAWGNYLIEEASKYNHKIDLFVCGDETKIDLWFNDEIKKSLDFYKISREEIQINATKLRQLIYDNEYLEFKKYINPKLYNFYSQIRFEIIKSNVETKQTFNFQFEDVFDDDDN